MITRDEILQMGEQHSELEGFAYAQVLTTCARAVWTQDCKLAKLLLSKHKVAKAHLDCIDNKVSLKDPGKFATTISNAKSFLLGQRFKSEAAEALPGKRAALSAAHQRLVKLWVPFDARACLAGV